MKTPASKSVVTLLKISVLCFVVLLLASSVSSTKKISNLVINHKYEVCHFGKTIIVSGSALKAHLGHGDGLGRCGQIPPPIQN